MDQALAHARKYAAETYNYARGVSLCPSDTGSWPLAELKRVFSVLGNTADEIGLELSEYCFMKPVKSLCGVLLNVQDQFSSCDICGHRDKCDRQNAGHDECAAGSK